MWGPLLRTAWQWVQMGGLISFGHWLGNDNPEKPGPLSGLSSTIKWIVVGAVVLIVYTLLGKKIKFGK